MLDSALEYQGGGIYAGTDNIIPAPEPSEFALTALGALFPASVAGGILRAVKGHKGVSIIDAVGRLLNICRRPSGSQAPSFHERTKAVAMPIFCRQVAGCEVFLHPFDLNPITDCPGDEVRINAIKPNFSFHRGGGSGIKWRMQTIGACLRRAIATLPLSLNEPHSFESRAIAVPLFPN